MKIKKKNLIKNFYLLLFIILFKTNSDPQFINFSSPYEWTFDQIRLFLYPDAENGDKGLNLSLNTEFGFDSKGFTSSKKTAFSNKNESKKTIPINFMGKKENFMNLFLGNNLSNNLGKFLQNYNLMKGQNSYGDISANGKFSFDAFYFSAEKWLTENIRFGFYLPLYSLNIKNINFSLNSNDEFFEYYLNDSKEFFENEYKSSKNYQKTGFGDSNLIFSWQDSFTEYRDLIRSITFSLRGGFQLPTGTYFDNDNTFFKIPFGYDALWGVLVGGSFEATFGKYFSPGISVDITSMFGKIKKRKIKTDQSQRDTFLLKMENSLVSPGFKEKYTLYGSLHDLEKSFLFTFGYQFNKQNESEIIVCSSEIPSKIASFMESLECWTTHHLFLNLQKNISKDNKDYLIGVFGKFGFNGENSIVSNSLGLSFSFLF